MLVFESRHVRRFVVRIERGEDVVASLKKLAMSERVRAAWVRGTGLCEWVELTDWDPDRESLRAPRRIEGPLALLACEGNVSMRLGEPYVELRAALSREGDAGLVVVGGQLAIASALNVELMCEVFEDVRLDRDEGRETGLSGVKGEKTPGVTARPSERVGRSMRDRAAEPSPVSSTSAAPRIVTAASRPEPIVEPAAPTASPPAAGGPVGWGDVARASAAVESAPSRDRKASSSVPLVPQFDKKPEASATSDEPEPKKGDWIDHRQFGLCRVDGEGVDGGLLVRLPSGMRKVIHTETLEVMQPRFEGDRRIFPLRPRTKR